MSAGTAEPEDSKQVYFKVMEQIKHVTGFLDNAVAIQKIAYEEARNKITAQNEEAERRIEKHKRLREVEKSLEGQIALVDAETDEREEENERLDKIFEESLRSLKWNARELVREMEARLTGFERDLADQLERVNGK